MIVSRCAEHGLDNRADGPSLLKWLLLPVSVLYSLLMLRLDMARNSLLTITTIISLVSMCLALGSCVAGIFGEEMTVWRSWHMSGACLTVSITRLLGMNLRNGNEDDINWFHGVVIALVLIMMAIFLVIYLVLVRAGMLAI